MRVCVCVYVRVCENTSYHKQKNLQALLVDIHEDPEGFTSFVKVQNAVHGGGGGNTVRGGFSRMTTAAAET